MYILYYVLSVKKLANARPALFKRYGFRHAIFWETGWNKTQSVRDDE